MTDGESSKSEPSSTGPAKRARRSRRGGRGRRRRTAAPSSGISTEPEAIADEPVTAPAAEPITEPEIADAPMSDSPIEEARREAADAAIEEQRDYEHTPEPIDRSYREPRERHDFRPASPAAVTEAIEEVNQIITSLREVLDQMEEVLETLELAEVQKTADEREIQSLRNSLRQFDRRGGGGNEPRREPHGQQSHSSPRHEPRRGRR